MQHIPRLALAVLAAALVAASAPAQNCGNTSVGLTPLNDLGAGTHQGFEGGLYPGGGNQRPLFHEIGGLRQVPQVVPRNAQGQPDPNGRIVFMSVGMSNTSIHFNAFRQLANADPLRDPRLFVFNGAQGGIPAEDMDDPADSYWTTVLPQKMQQQGVHPLEVQVVWLLQANRRPMDPFPDHALTLKSQLASIARIVKDELPNVRILYLGNRIYAGYATGDLNPEPYAYEQGFANKWLIADQMAGDPGLNFDPARGPVEAPWIAWGPYTWADGLVPRSDGLTWECSDFNPDGTHPSQQGAMKNMAFLLDFVHTDSTARAWYLAEPDPLVYGIAKPTSLGAPASIGWSGTPSLAANDFEIALSGAPPSKPTIAFRGMAPANLPFFGARLHVGPPLQRLPAQLTDPSGAASYAIPIVPPMVGRTDHFQFFFRDPQNPDGTGVALSDALQVRYR